MKFMFFEVFKLAKNEIHAFRGYYTRVGNHNVTWIIKILKNVCCAKWRFLFYDKQTSIYGECLHPSSRSASYVYYFHRNLSRTVSILSKSYHWLFHRLRLFFLSCFRNNNPLILYTIHIHHLEMTVNFLQALPWIRIWPFSVMTLILLTLCESFLMAYVRQNYVQEGMITVIFSHIAACTVIFAWSLQWQFDISHHPFKVATLSVAVGICVQYRLNCYYAVSDFAHYATCIVVMVSMWTTVEKTVAILNGAYRLNFHHYDCISAVLALYMFRKWWPGVVPRRPRARERYYRDNIERRLVERLRRS